MTTRLLALSLALAGCATTTAATVTEPADALPKDAAKIDTDTLAALVDKPAAASPVPFAPLPATAPLQVVLLPSSKPVVSVRLVFRTGSVDDPPGKEGLTALTTRLMVEGGTKTLTSAQLLEALYPMAAQLDADTDKEFTTVTGRVHVERLPRYLELLTEVLTAPRFDRNEFTRMRADALNAIKARLRQENDEELSKVALDALLYEGHPYRHFTGGTVAGLEALTLDDVRAHAARVFTQDRLVIGLAGAVDQALADKVKASLAALPKEGAPRAPLPTAPGPRGKTLIVERDTDSTAGAFGFTTSVRRGADAFVALFIAASYLGEHRQEHGVLFNELREKRGLNYGTYAYAQHYRQDGWDSVPRPNILRSQQDLSIWLRPVATANAVFATRGVLHFLERARTEPLPADRFATAKGFLAGATRIWTQTDQRRLGWAIDDVLSGSGDFLGAVRQRLETITADEVQAALRKELAPTALNFAFVTRDGKALAASLTSKTPTPITYPSPKPADVTREDELVSRALLPMAADQVQVISAQQVMAR